jgi:hypothetical protein
VVIESWRRHYNEVRPHSSLGYLAPAEFVARLGSSVAAGNGSDRCGMRSLRAPTRCIIVPRGASEGRAEADLSRQVCPEVGQVTRASIGSTRESSSLLAQHHTSN